MMTLQDPRQVDAERTRSNSILLIAIVIGLLGLGITLNVYLDRIWLVILAAVVNIALIGLATARNPRFLKGRGAAYSVNSTITLVLTLGILVVINYVGYKYPFKKDVTKNQLYSLSPQTIKVAKELPQPLKMSFFASPLVAGEPRERFRPFLENIAHLNRKIELEFVDPNQEMMRSKQIGLKAQGTLVLNYLNRTSKIEALTEEKFTNALIKISKEKTSTVCSIIGHGERSLTAPGQSGFDSLKKAMSDQAYEVKEVSLFTEGKIPEVCDAIIILGATRAFLDKEVTILDQYLANGGHAIFTMEIDPKGEEPTIELLKLVNKWYIQPVHALIIDPKSPGNTLPLVDQFSKEIAITKDFASDDQAVFPLARPLDVMPNPPSSLKLQWVVKTNARAWAENDFKSLSSGHAAYSAGKRQGPLTVGIAAEGKLAGSTAKNDSRLVVFGSTEVFGNTFGRSGVNRDIFMNALSWSLHDENVISIRKRDDDTARIELSGQGFQLIWWIVGAAIPGLIFIGGVVVWLTRRGK